MFEQPDRCSSIKFGLDAHVFVVILATHVSLCCCVSMMSETVTPEYSKGIDTDGSACGRTYHHWQDHGVSGGIYHAFPCALPNYRLQLDDYVLVPLEWKLPP